jgi:hypothetical protein
MSVTLAVRALRNVSFGIRGFKFNVALLEEFYLEDFFVIGGMFEIHKKHGEGKFGETVFDVEDVCYRVT